MVSIKDVAKKAGVSISTVSLAFNYPERVSEKTRKKIFRATKELEYVPASVAKKNELKEQKKKSVAVIMGSLVGPFWFEVLRGINETLNINKTEMVLFSGEDSLTKHFMDLIKGNSCQGIIIITGGGECEQLLQIAVNKGFPVVLCCPPREYAGLSNIMIDNWNVGQLAANYFLQLGRKRMAVFGKCPEDCPDREIGFLEVLKKEKKEVPENWRLYFDVKEEEAYRAAKKFLRENKELPDAIFGINDETAIGTITALREEGIKVPEEISVIGCDNISISQFVQPPLTTIEIPKFEVGILAANMILRRIRGMPTENIMLSGKLIIRESAAKSKES